MENLDNIQLGYALVLKDIDSKEVFIDVVTSVENPDNHEDFFQIRTKRFDYDFQNFFEICDIIKIDSCKKKRNLGEIYGAFSSTDIRITNKTHLHSNNTKSDTLCSKNFVFPGTTDHPFEFEQGFFWDNIGQKIDTSIICKKCLNVFLRNFSKSL